MKMRSKGFVLIDLLTTTIIITILAAILFPVFAKAREKARQTVCQSNLQQIGMALRVYAKDNYGHFPPTESYPSALTPYLQEKGVLMCPSNLSASLSSYVYRGGWSCDDAASTIIAYDSQVIWHGKTIAAHNEGFNVLWLDGHVKWLSESYKSGKEAFDYGLKGLEPPRMWTTPPPSLPQGKAPPPGGISGGMPGGPPGAPGGPPPNLEGAGRKGGGNP